MLNMLHELVSEVAPHTKHDTNVPPVVDIKNHELAADELEITRAPAEPRDFKLLTYNIYVRPPTPSLTRDEYKDQRLDLFREMYVEKFDLILLQEAFQAFSWRTSNFAHRIKDELGYDFVLSTPSSLLRSVFKFKPIVDGGCRKIKENEARQRDAFRFEVRRS